MSSLHRAFLEPKAKSGAKSEDVISRCLTLLMNYLQTCDSGFPGYGESHMNIHSFKTSALISILSVNGSPPDDVHSIGTCLDLTISGPSCHSRLFNV